MSRKDPIRHGGWGTRKWVCFVSFGIICTCPIVEMGSFCWFSYLQWHVRGRTCPTRDILRRTVGKVRPRTCHSTLQMGSFHRLCAMSSGEDDRRHPQMGLFCHFWCHAHVSDRSNGFVSSVLVSYTCVGSPAFLQKEHSSWNQANRVRIRLTGNRYDEPDASGQF